MELGAMALSTLLNILLDRLCSLVELLRNASKQK